MKTFFSESQLLHVPDREFVAGEFRPAMETPARAELIVSSIASLDLGPILIPPPCTRATIERVHDPGFVEFVSSLDKDWSASFPGTTPFPESAVAPGMRRVLPSGLRAKLSYFCFDTCTPIGENTWTAAMASASSALAGITALEQGDRQCFSLCRPPGHHAGSDFYGGYCFLNNAAIAAQFWVDSKRSKCAILDVDYHHGNGTQEIFYERDDIFYVSLHGEPSTTYPFFSGYADEIGHGRGRGTNLNIPLQQGTRWTDYAPPLHHALDTLKSFAPEALIVSLGVDTSEDDPIAAFRLKTEDFTLMGGLIAQLKVPTLVVMEGGYAVSKIGENVARFLGGLAETGDQLTTLSGKQSKT
jgi:acetoin utilization deacetylase AcuC-like enzyme